MKPLLAKACSTILLAVVGFGCHGSSERTGDTLEVIITGTPAAWADVAGVEVAGKRVMLPPSGMPPHDLVTDLFLCTADTKRFLSMATFAVHITKTDGQTIDSKVERIACRFSRNPGHFETAQVRLQEDGQIDSDFGKGRADVWTDCAQGDPPWTCAKDDL